MVVHKNVRQYFEDGNQPISKHSTIEGFEFQRAYVEGGRKYYLFVEKGTKIEDYANGPRCSSE